uniref:Putative secreted protein n=1 Tax=Rhipicephalus microplus TaxID=6941 RepID=A0A6G5A2Q2_RHIMP
MCHHISINFTTFFCSYSVVLFSLVLAARAVLCVYAFLVPESTDRGSCARRHVVTCTLVTVNLCVKECVKSIVTLYDHVVPSN